MGLWGGINVKVRLIINARCLHLRWGQIVDIVIFTRHVNSVFFPCDGSHRQHRALSRPNIGKGRDSKPADRLGKAKEREQEVAYYEMPEHFGAHSPQNRNLQTIPSRIEAQPFNVRLTLLFYTAVFSFAFRRFLST